MKLSIIEWLRTYSGLIMAKHYLEKSPDSQSLEIKNIVGKLQNIISKIENDSNIKSNTSRFQPPINTDLWADTREESLNNLID